MRNIFRLLALTMFAAAAPAAAEWHRATSPHFEIYSNDNVAEVRARAERLERFDAALRRISGINPEQESRPITVFFVRDVSVIQRMLGPSYSGAAGFYSPRTAGSLIVVPSDTPWISAVR
jgi:hypothetical protein